MRLRRLRSKRQEPHAQGRRALTTSALFISSSTRQWARKPVPFPRAIRTPSSAFTLPLAFPALSRVRGLFPLLPLRPATRPSWPSRCLPRRGLPTEPNRHVLQTKQSSTTPKPGESSKAINHSYYIYTTPAQASQEAGPTLTSREFPFTSREPSRRRILRSLQPPPPPGSWSPPPRLFRETELRKPF